MKIIIAIGIILAVLLALGIIGYIIIAHFVLKGFNKARKDFLNDFKQ